jgi:hypothetical protein
MPSVTYYVAMPFLRNEEGDLAAGEGRQMTSAHAAQREAERMSMVAAGAVAFARTGDPQSGEFEPGVVIAIFGEVGEVE